MEHELEEGEEREEARHGRRRRPEELVVVRRDVVRAQLGELVQGRGGGDPEGGGVEGD